MKKIFINEFFSDKNEKLVNIEAKRLKRDFLTENDVNYLHQNHLRLFWKRLLIFKISIGLSTFISIDIHTNPLYPATQFAVLSTIPGGPCRLLLILIRFILFWILITFLSDFLEVFLACLTHTFLGFERIL